MSVGVTLSCFTANSLIGYLVPITCAHVYSCEFGSLVLWMYTGMLISVHFSCSGSSAICLGVFLITAACQCVMFDNP